MAGCSDCISENGGCCHVVLENGWKILLFPDEIKRISEISGKSPAEFVDTSPVCSSQMEWYESRFAQEDPLWFRLVSEWKEPTGISGKCPFLSQEGCALPYDKKPFICQIYPLDFNLTSGKLYMPDDSNCPVMDDYHSMQGVLAYFNDDSEAIGRRHETFRQECLALLAGMEQVGAKVAAKSKSKRAR